MQTKLTNDIYEAAGYIKDSQVTAFPTETVYGLGANAYDEKAVSKIFRLKGRPQDNPLIVHIAEKKDIKVLASEINNTAAQIIKEYFPGPITVILKKNEIIPDIVTAGLDTIAVRMPSLKIAKNFIKACGVPVAAPSANLSGSPSPTSFTHVLKDFAGKIPCIIIGPQSEYGIESTVVDCTSETAEILRPGIITAEELRNAGIKISVSSFNDINIKTARSPGQKYRHYSPKAKVKIVSSQKTFEENSAYIGISPAVKFTKNIKLKKSCRNLYDYAKNLFSFFRECDDKGIKIIYAEKVEEKGIGIAIMNRLKKASS